LHRSILLALHGGNARQGRGQYGNKSPGLSLCLDNGSVRNHKFSQILKDDLSIEEPCGAFQTVLCAPPILPPALIAESFSLDYVPPCSRESFHLGLNAKPKNTSSDPTHFEFC
jgi:hypothetical protein